MHYIASCAPPSATIRVPAEYFFPSPCSLKSVSRPEVHTLRSAIRPRRTPCSCRLCQRVVREGHLSVLAPNREVLVMSPFFGFPSYISSETTGTLSVHCTCLRSARVAGEWDFVCGGALRPYGAYSGWQDCQFGLGRLRPALPARRRPAGPLLPPAGGWQTTAGLPPRRRRAPAGAPVLPTPCGRWEPAPAVTAGGAAAHTYLPGSQRRIVVAIGQDQPQTPRITSTPQTSRPIECRALPLPPPHLPSPHLPSPHLPSSPPGDTAGPT